MITVEEARRDVVLKRRDAKPFLDAIDTLILAVQEQVVRRIFDGEDWPWVIDYLPSGDEVMVWLLSGKAADNETTARRKLAEMEEWPQGLSESLADQDRLYRERAAAWARENR